MGDELVVLLLFVLYIIGLAFEHRAEMRSRKESADALRELMAMAKRKDKKGRDARMMLAVWASTPPSF